MGSILWTLITVLVAFWILGFALHLGGWLIHILLAIAAVMFIINLLSGRGAKAS